MRLHSFPTRRSSDLDGIYRWRSGKHSGEAATLDEAKRAVEQAVLGGASQLGLFDK